MELGLIFLGLAVVAAAAIFAFARRPAPAAPATDTRLDTVIAGLGTVQGRFQEAIEAQAALQRTLAERLDALQKRVTDSLAETTVKTGETLGSLSERLNVIDQAQQNITALSGQVMTLERIFSDKQQRGAFAQDIMESIVSDHMAPDQYEFQAKLSNGKIVDCAIRIPNVTARIMVDSKFPHEGFEGLRNADGEEARKAAMVQIRNDINIHVKAISEKYLIAGETQSPAVMFVPSDAMYLELQASFPETLKKARQAQVVIASPHVFMLIVTTLLGLMRDARMREQADMIRKEVGLLLNDVRLLDDRVEKLRRHFGQADTDIKDILISTGKITGRAEKIEKVELENPAALPKA
jgi:DNA recombination protein RmuC